MKRVAPVLGVVAALGLAAAQARAQRGGAPTQPVFRSTTQLVLVDAIVTDDNDRVVADLTRDEFVITEGGRAQRIVEFSFESIAPANRVVDLDAPTRPPADVAWNARTSGRSRAFVFVIDEASIPPRELIPLKRLMAEVLKTLTPDDQAAVIYMGRSDLGTDFTNDIDRLVDVVNKRREALGLSMMTPARKMATLRNVVRTLESSRHARRAVFLVGSFGCVPQMPQDQWGECRDLVKQAREAGVPFYTLDPRLFIDADVTAGNSPGERGAARGAELLKRDEMLTLASATGGRASSRAGDPVRAAQQVIAENGSYYLLGFYPDPPAVDGKFHEINVSVTRPGLRVRARLGYKGAAPPARSSTPVRDMTETLGAGVDDPSLPIRVFAAPIGPAANGRTRALVTIEVSYPMGTSEGDLDEDLRVGILALTPDAKIKASFQRPINLAGGRRPGANATFVVNETIDLPTEKLSLRVGVRSRALARSGTAHLYVDPPDFTGKDLTLSGILIGAAKDAADATGGLESLQGIAPFQPITRRTFATGETIRLFARAFWKRNADSARVTIQIVGSEPRPPQTIELPGRPGAGGVREAELDGELPLTGLAAGAYVLRIEAALPSGAAVVRQVPFEIQ
jgi:VWFA-related protein